MEFIYHVIGCTLMLVTFVMGAFPPNMLSTYFNTQYVKPGSSAQEKCQAGGDPKPTYIWKKDGVVLSMDAYYEINPNTGDIKIKAVTVLNGEGTYQCFATNSQGTALSGFWEVKVAYLTAFDQGKTTSPTMNEYSYYSLPCKHQPSSVPASKLDWLVGAGDNTTFPTTPEDKYRIVQDADGTLHFLFARASDNANNPYRCQLFNNVVNETAISLEKFNLNVSRGSELTSKPILKYSKSVEGTIGSKATLLCIFAGNPIPNVEWLKDGVKLPDGSSLPDGTSRYKIDPEDSTGRKLIISKLEIKDEGDYICCATNTDGTNEGTVKVTVTGSINILSGLPDKQKVQPGDIINCTISAQTDALEQKNLRYDWYIGGKKYPDQFPLGIWSQIIKLSMGNTHIVIDTSTLTTHDDKLFQQLMGNLSVRVYTKFDQRIISMELYTEIIYPTPAPVIVAELNSWHIALIIGILILFVIVALIFCDHYRNRVGNYQLYQQI